MIKFSFFIIIFALIVFFYAWHQIYNWQKKIRKEIKEAEKAVDSALDSLRHKIEKEVEFLDNEPGLSKEEKEIRDRLYQALERSGEAIKKEIKDIKKSIS